MIRLRVVDAVVAAALTMAAFVGSFGLYPWYDDWMYMSAAGNALAHGAPGEFLWAAFPPHWSPISFAFELLNLRLVSWDNDVFVRVVVAVLVFGGLLVFAWLARSIGLGGPAVAAGMATLALHHANAAAFYAFDCYDQIAADLLTWTSLVLVWRAIAAPRRRAPGLLAAAAVLYAPALLIKEQALALCASVVVIAVWVFMRPRLRVSRWRIGALALALVVMSGAFAVARWRAGLLFEASGPYRLCLTCVPGNVGLLVTSLVVPVRTLEVFLALQGRAWPPDLHVVMAGVASAGVLLFVAGGLVRHSRVHGAGRAVLAGALLLSSLFPVVLLPGVTELYAHTALFWFGLMVAMAADGWLASGETRRLWRGAVGGALIVYVVTLGSGLRANRGDMRASGERSRVWSDRMHAALEAVPLHDTVLVRGLLMVKAPGDYGLYRVTSPGYLLAGKAGVSWRVPGIALCVPGEACAEDAAWIADVDEEHERVVVRRVNGRR